MRSSNEETAKDLPKDGSKLNREVICDLSRVKVWFTKRTNSPQSGDEVFSPSNFTAYIVQHVPWFHEMKNGAYRRTESF